MSFELRGAVEMSAKLRAMAERSPGAVARGIYVTTERIATEAKLETPVGGPPYSPRDKTPGTLRASIHATPPVVEGTRVTGTVGAGGAASAYARRQHEETTWRHHVGKSHFIEDPFNRIAPTAGDAIAAELRRELKS